MNYFFEKNIKLVSLIAGVSLAVPLFFAIGIKKSEAVGIPFGGKITNVKICTCLYAPSLTLTISSTVKGKNGGKYSLYFYPIPSLIYANWQVYRPGAWVVGQLSSPVSVCLKQKGWWCSKNGTTDGLIQMIGTSW